MSYLELANKRCQHIFSKINITLTNKYYQVMAFITWDLTIFLIQETSTNKGRTFFYLANVVDIVSDMIMFSQKEAWLWESEGVQVVKRRKRKQLKIYLFYKKL